MPYQRSARTAAVMPMSSASTSATTNDSSASGRVTARRAPTSGPTGRVLMYESPSSPLRSCAAQVANCCSSGWSDPTWARAAAI